MENFFFVVIFVFSWILLLHWFICLDNLLIYIQELTFNVSIMNHSYWSTTFVLAFYFYHSCCCCCYFFVKFLLDIAMTFTHNESEINKKKTKTKEIEEEEVEEKDEERIKPLNWTRYNVQRWNKYRGQMGVCVIKQIIFKSQLSLLCHHLTIGKGLKMKLLLRRN